MYIASTAPDVFRVFDLNAYLTMLNINVYAYRVYA